MIEDSLEVATADGPMAVLRKRPTGPGPFPVIVMFHDGPGIREATHQVMASIAAAGFYVVAPDRYHRFGRFVHVEPEALIAAGRDSELMRSFFAMVTATTDDKIRLDLDALLAVLARDSVARSAAYGCIGYCNGARTVLRVMSEHPSRFRAGAALHPSFCIDDDAQSPHLAVRNIPGELYVAIGEADHLASVEHNRPLIDELTKLGARAEVEVLPGADHGFAMPGPSYNHEAATRAHQRAVALWTRVL
jgi:carboxymethylenebutenolidase